MKATIIFYLLLGMVFMPCLLVLNDSGDLRLNLIGLAYSLILLCVGKCTTIGEKAAQMAEKAYFCVFNEKLEE